MHIKVTELSAGWQKKIIEISQHRSVSLYCEKTSASPHHVQPPHLAPLMVSDPSTQKTSASTSKIEGHVTKLRCREVKPFFMGNYANMCSETRDRNLSPKTVAKLLFFNWKSTWSRFSCPQWQISHIYSHPGVIEAAAGCMSCVILSSVKVGFWPFGAETPALVKVAI